MNFLGGVNLLLFVWFAVIVSFDFSSVSYADDSIYPVECLYDSVYLKIKRDYTAEILFKQQFLFHQSRKTEYSIIKIPVNRYVGFYLIDVTTSLPDGRQFNLDKDDIETVSDFGPRYYPDNKTKILHIPLTRIGAISTISYRLRYKSLLYLPQFFRQRDIPTFNSWLEVSSEIPYTHFAPGNYFVLLVTDSTIGFWSKEIPAYNRELHMPPVESYRIVVRPDTVIYEGYKHGFNSWAEVAAFYNNLSEDRQKPDIKITTLAESLCADARSQTDSLEALFGFVRDNIRYISVDIGRGEFKPLFACDVLSKRYGDCKDQSALLTSLYRAVGFKASPALITTRDSPDILTPLPWPGYFNHVITAVDTGDGYLFLDASQSTCCFGKLPAKLRNRRALICGTEPFLDFTLTSPYDTGNLLDFDLTYRVGSGSEIRCDVQLKIYNDPAFALYASSPEKALIDLLDIFFSKTGAEQYRSNFRIDRLSPENIEVSGHFFEQLPVPSRGNGRLIKIHSAFIDYLKKYFFPPERKQPYAFDFTFRMNETTRLELSDGFIVKKYPAILSFDEQGIHSRLSLVSDSNFCRIDRDFILLNYTISPEQYNKFYDFLLTVSQIAYNSIEIKME